MKDPTLEGKEKILAELFELGCTAVEQDGADSIIFGCTGFTDFSAPLNELISAKFGENVPVMDPNCCAIGYLIMLVKNGVSQSGLSYPNKGE